VNGSQLAFGVRQNGQPVNNVQLPPWANGPDDMLAKHRYALDEAQCPLHVPRCLKVCRYSAACAMVGANPAVTVNVVPALTMSSEPWLLAHTNTPNTMSYSCVHDAVSSLQGCS
jgi:hypothetical protein